MRDSSFYRYDENEFGGQNPIPNRAMVKGVKSTGFFFSLSNPYMSDYLMKDIDLYMAQTFDVNTLDNRTFPGSLANVKYFVVKTGLERYLPYGYTKLVKASGDYEVYKNKYALPFGYTYDKSIPKAEYEKLSSVEKQQALLQGAVVDSSASNSLETTTPVFNDKIISYQVKYGTGISSKDGTFTVNKKNASIILSFSGLERSETYLYIKNLDFKGGRASSAPLMIKSGKIEKQIWYQTPAYPWYADRHDFLVNLGYAVKQKVGIKITFGIEGTYSLDSLQVVCQPMSAYPAQAKALKQTALKNVHVSIDRVTGTISADKAKLLCLTIPYSNGWTAQVDGKKAEVLNVNTMWSGLYLPAGNHTITLQYETPYFRQGLILSIVGFALLAAVIVFHERRRSAQKEERPICAS